VGTGGNFDPITGTHYWGLLRWIKTLPNIMFDQSHVDYQIKTILNKNYLRVNSKLENASDDLDNNTKENLDALEELGGRWWMEFGEDVCKLLDEKN
jgi:hypothetical protein